MSAAESMNYSHHHLSDTIVALATPPGVGAIGVIRLSGNDAIHIVQKVFNGKDLTRQAGYTLHFGTISNESGKVLDEVVASVFKAPHSYTGENAVEVSCHGSPFILRQVLELLIRQGARLAQAGEFTLRAFLNGKMDLSQAEAVADLIASTSESAHSVAMRQMRGGFSHEIKKLREELVNFASLIELELDFGEEDVEFANRSELKKLVEQIQHLIRSLINSFRLGNVIKNGVPTVIAGRPNAGKSTLLNTLLNEERAIVSDIAGTTRDAIEEILNIKGIEFRLIDTAGIREAQSQIEAIGVEKTLEKVRQAAVLVYVFDVGKTKLDEVFFDIEKLHGEDMRLLIVCNKMDTNPYFKPQWLTHPDDPSIPETFFSMPKKNRPPLPPPALQGSEQPIITLSALHGMNIPYLKEKLYDLVVTDPTSLENPIVTNVRHYEALQKASLSLNDVLQGLHENVTSDFVAMDIRRALVFLAEILGQISTEDLLETIFSRFCIGK